MSFNPFAIPDDLKSSDATSVDTVGDVPSAEPLHPLSGVVFATFFGTPIAGAVVIGLSLWRLGRHTVAIMVVAATLLLMCVFFAAIMVLPGIENLPGTALALPQIVIMYFLGKQLYGRELQRQEETHGPVASKWKGAGIGLLVLLVIASVSFGALVVSEGVGLSDISALFADHGTVVEFAEDEVYIDGNATRYDAKTLADALKELGYFGGTGTSVRLRREAGQTIVSFVLRDGAWEDESTVEGFRQVGIQLSRAGFSPPLSIELCDDSFKVQRSLTIE